MDELQARRPCVRLMRVWAAGPAVSSDEAQLRDGLEAELRAATGGQAPEAGRAQQAPAAAAQGLGQDASEAAPAMDAMSSQVRLEWCQSSHQHVPA